MARLRSTRLNVPGQNGRRERKARGWSNVNGLGVMMRQSRTDKAPNRLSTVLLLMFPLLTAAVRGETANRDASVTNSPPLLMRAVEPQKLGGELVCVYSFSSW
jgi:hypothetical protein